MGGITSETFLPGALRLREGFRAGSGAGLLAGAALLAFAAIFFFATTGVLTRDLVGPADFLTAFFVLFFSAFIGHLDGKGEALHNLYIGEDYAQKKRSCNGKGGPQNPRLQCQAVLLLKNYTQLEQFKLQ